MYCIIVATRYKAYSSSSLSLVRSRTHTKTRTTNYAHSFGDPVNCSFVSHKAQKCPKRIHQIGNDSVSNIFYENTNKCTARRVRPYKHTHTDLAVPPFGRITNAGPRNWYIWTWDTSNTNILGFSVSYCCCWELVTVFCSVTHEQERQTHKCVVVHAESRKTVENMWLSEL